MLQCSLFICQLDEAIAPIRNTTGTHNPATSHFTSRGWHWNAWTTCFQNTINLPISPPTWLLIQTHKLRRKRQNGERWLLNPVEDARCLPICQLNPWQAALTLPGSQAASQTLLHCSRPTRWTIRLKTSTTAPLKRCRHCCSTVLQLHTPSDTSVVSVCLPNAEKSGPGQANAGLAQS